jgi:PhoH-like ATPase
MAKKHFIVDTNVLIDNPDVLRILTNGEDGKDKNQVYLTHTIINELDGLKRDNKLRPQVQEVIKNLIEYKDMIKIIGHPDNNYNNDNKILAEIANTKIENPILVTSDFLMRFKADVYHGIVTQEFKESMPFKSDSERFTGFVDEYDDETPNCFGFVDGKLHMFNPHLDPVLIPNHEVWKIKPKTAYQNAAIHLITNDEIDIISIQSPAGLGKSLISLASALYLTLEKKQYRKIYVVKNTIEIGKELGFLPGTLESKIDPFFKPVKDLLLALHEDRNANRLFLDIQNGNAILNPKYIEFIPINHMRGMNIDNAIVIIEEAQNFSRIQIRTIMTRMGENVKCIINGDTNQVDNSHLNTENNGLNWVVRMLKGQPNYGHIVLQGSKSRGPICNTILKTGL